MIISLAVYTIAGFLIAPLIAKSVLIKKLSEELNREVAIQKIKINPFVLSTTLRGLDVKDINNTSTFLSFDELYLNLQLETLLKKSLRLKEIRIIGPHINIRSTGGNSYNYSDLTEADQEKPESEIGLPKLSIDVIHILNAKVTIQESPVINIPLVRVSGIATNPVSNKINISDVLVESPEIHLERDHHGRITLTPIITGGSDEKSVKHPRETAPYLQFNADEIRVSSGNIFFSDLSNEEPVESKLERINLTATNISNTNDIQGSLSLAGQLNGAGSVSISGSVSITPIFADLELSFKEIDIIPFQPYFTGRTNILLTDGKAFAEGRVSVRHSEEQGLHLSYAGEASLSELASVDKAHHEDFLKLKSLYLNGIETGYSPLLIKINKVALTDFYSRLIINPDGTLNVQGMFGNNEKKLETADTSGVDREKPVSDEQRDKRVITVDAVTLQGGTVNFSDRHIKPAYSVNLLEIGGRVSGLSSDEKTSADVDLRGKLENYAPLEITGKINPLRNDLFVDLRVDFKQMDISSLTPYSGKYAGYTIEKGKLSLDLKYLIAEKKIDSQNKVLLDQFTLGDRVDSPDATKLPVKLAIALLKNPKGEINLDLPVKGDLANPQFSLGNIIGKMVMNILVKAATSPFALLGALIPETGEELSYIDFDYGSFNINEHAESKIQTLTKVLNERPSLNLGISGYVDLEKDREALRQYFFNRKIKAQKLIDMGNGKADDIDIGPDEYEKYLRKAYKAETFPKPRNVLGIAKNLPVPEMEKLMLTNIEVNDDNLRTLASQRALTVKDHILRSGDIDQQRILLTEPEQLEPKKSKKLNNSRVDFKLK